MNELASYDGNKVLIDIKRKLKEGNTQHDITSWIKENYKISNQSIVFYIRQAKDLLEREIDFNIRDVIIKHTGRYEKIWEKNFKNPSSKKLDNPDDDLEDKNIRKTLFKIKNHYMTAAKALEQKEKMLGLVHNRMDVDLKNEFFEQERKNNDSLDPSALNLDKLDLKEKLELLHLLKKSKGEIVEETETQVTTTITVQQGNQKEELKYEEGVVDQFDVEETTYEEVKEQPRELLVENINKNLVEGESKRLDDELKVAKNIEKKKKFDLAKKKLLLKYKKSNKN